MVNGKARALGKGPSPAIPADEGRAFAWLTSLRKRESTFADAEQQLRAYLASKGCGKEHIREQLERLYAMFGPWLP